MESNIPGLKRALESNSEGWGLELFSLGKALNNLVTQKAQETRLIICSLHHKKKNHLLSLLKVTVVLFKAMEDLTHPFVLQNFRCARKKGPSFGVPLFHSNISRNS